jgi:integral membrane protein (TIGR01906 family)
MDRAKKRVKADVRGRAMAWLFLLCALLGCLLGVTLRAEHYCDYVVSSINDPLVKILIESDFWGLDQLFEAIPRALNGDLDALRLTVRDREGQEQQAFTEREIAHMADVAELYRLAKIALAVFGGMLLALAVWTWHGCWHYGGKASVAKGMLWGTLDIFALMVAVALWAMIDFRSIFWAFHHIAFTNDLWLLDPGDLLILLMPQRFFEATVMQIALYWLGCVVLWLQIACALLRREKRKREGKVPLSEYFDSARAQAERLRGVGHATILAIETSCDETAVAVVRDGRHALSSVLHSQIALRRRGAGDRLPFTCGNCRAADPSGITRREREQRGDRRRSRHNRAGPDRGIACRVKLRQIPRFRLGCAPDSRAPSARACGIAVLDRHAAHPPLCRARGIRRAQLALSCKRLRGLSASRRHP